MSVSIEDSVVERCIELFCISLVDSTIVSMNQLVLATVFPLEGVNPRMNASPLAESIR